MTDDEVHEQITYRLVERLIDPSDKICLYVHKLSIVDFRGDEKSYCLNTGLIRTCLSNLQRLDTFSWSCDAPFPIDVLSILQKRFPKAQLCANVGTLDQILISASQLHRMQVSVPCADLSGSHSISMFRPLKKAVLQLPNLRHLCIDTHRNVDVHNLEGASLDSRFIPLEFGDRLPALNSLEFLSTSYSFTENHCLRLLASIDCKKLQCLKLGPPNPVHFFEVFLARLPSLTHLDISYTSTRVDPWHLRLDSCTKFIVGLKSLRRLVVRCDILNLHVDFFQQLADAHGSSLRHLSFQARQESFGGPQYRGDICEYLFKFTNLQSLDMALPSLGGQKCTDCEEYHWGVSIRNGTSVQWLNLVGPQPILVRLPSSIITKRSHLRPCTTHRVFHGQVHQQTCSLHHMPSLDNNHQPANHESRNIQCTLMEMGDRP